MEPEQRLAGSRSATVAGDATAGHRRAEKAHLSSTTDLRPVPVVVRRECRRPVSRRRSSWRWLMRMPRRTWTCGRRHGGHRRRPTPEGCYVCCRVFVFSVIWAVGATVDEASRVRFDAFLRQLLEGGARILAREGAPQPSSQQLKMTKGPPDKGGVRLAPRRTRRWIEWLRPCRRTRCPGSKFTDINVQTRTRCSTGTSSDVVDVHGYSCSCGNTGTGKTVLSQRLLAFSTRSPVIFPNSPRRPRRGLQGIVDSSSTSCAQGHLRPALRQAVRRPSPRPPHPRAADVRRPAPHRAASAVDGP